jgi:hypothetical protein
MAAGFVRNIKNKIDNLLHQIKKGLKEEGSKNSTESALKQLPTPDSIKTKFEDLANKNPKEAEQYYTKTKNKLEGIKSGLESSLTNIQRADEKLGVIDEDINKIARIAEALEPFLAPTQALLALQATAIAASNAPPAGSGLTAGAIAASEARRKTLALISLLVSLVAVAVPMVETVDKNIDKIRSIVPSALTQINNVIDLVQSLLDLLEQLYIDLLSPLLEGYGEIDGGIDNVEDLYNQYPELETFLTSEGDIDLSDEDLSYGPYGTTNGISNVPPKYFKRYRKKPYTDIY